MENLDIYKKYKEVPKNALKDFDNGRFKGADINTMWRIKSLTEYFGPVGKGWYYKPVKLWTENCENGDIFAFAEIELFVKYDNEWSMAISGTGGNKLQNKIKSGDIKTSDEAYKMAVTDALGVACKLLGFGADVYWQHDKSKYTEDEVENKTKKLEKVEKPKDEPEHTHIVNLKDKLMKRLLELGTEQEKYFAYRKVSSLSEISVEQLEEDIKRKAGK